MRATAIALVLVVSLVMAGQATGFSLPQTQTEPQIKLEAVLINVPVVVCDKKTGEVYQNLGPQNFQVFEDKVRQEITNYVLQYGFFGLGMVINLALFGVSREYEAEADQLGAQYAWAAGYDPKGFITFFDKMASEKGYVRSASFFRTHPPFFDRIASTFSEIAYLPPKENLEVDAPAFHQAKERLKKVMKEGQEEKKKRPTLRRLPECRDEQEEAASDSHI